MAASGVIPSGSVLDLSAESIARLSLLNQQIVNGMLPPADLIAIDIGNGNADGTGWVHNKKVTLSRAWKYCFKLQTSSALAAATFTTNIYLHFQSLQWQVQPFGGPVGDYLMFSNFQNNCWPLENRFTLNRFVWKFNKGLPQQVFLSADFQGDSRHFDIICFTDSPHFLKMSNIVSFF